MPSHNIHRFFSIPKENNKIKSTPSNIFLTLCLLVFYITCVTPFFLFVVVPAAAFFNFYTKIVAKKFTSQPSSQHQLQQQQSLPLSSADVDINTILPHNTRPYDLIVFGATGFTGQLAAKYIATRYSASNFKWAIAGRRPQALQALRTDLARIAPHLQGLPIVIADSTNPDSLKSMIASTKVIITTAGPFAKYGQDIVKFCALLGTHYCDITGESDFVRKIIDYYDDAAKASGATIVPHCGHDCLPWDIATWHAAQQFKQKGEQLVSIHFYDDIKGSMSGGTLLTLVTSLADRIKYKAALGFDPMLKDTNGVKSTAKFTIDHVVFPRYSHFANAWLSPFFMAPVMANCVRRSNVLCHYSPALTYTEGFVDSFANSCVSTINTYLLLAIASIPPLGKFATTKVLPPGQGPTQEEMDASYLSITGRFQGSKGSVLVSNMYFPADAGYKETARMLVEAALCFVLQKDQPSPPLRFPPGIHTPASALGDVVLKRIVDSGTQFSWEFVSDKKTP